jgi:hypothetical protein
MKNKKKLLMASIVLGLFTQCKSPMADNLLKNEELRGKVISLLISKKEYASQLMDSLMHGGNKMQLMAGQGEMMEKMMSDTAMLGTMLEKMTGMCAKDSSMCRRMVSKTMMMCKGDQSKCGMMAGMMCGNKEMMKSMMHSMHEKGMMDKACMEKCKSSMGLKNVSVKNQHKQRST